MTIVFFGTPDFVIPVLESITEHFTLAGIVTTPDTVQGRKNILTPSPVKQFAKEQKLDVPVFTPEKLTDEIAGDLKDLNPDLFVVAAYGKIIPQSLLDIPTYGSINIHPSLLPKYRGPSPIQTTLLNGDRISGVTLILMDQEIDHGPILAQEKMVVEPTDTFTTLHTKMFEKSSEMLPHVMTDFINKKITPKEQDHMNATFCDHITKKSGYFDLQNPPTPQELDRMIRAYYPWPTAWTRFTTKKGQEKILKLLPERMIQIEGGKPMPRKEFFNGYPEMRETIERVLGE